MEERRKQDGRRDEFLEKFFKLEVAVQRLTEHEALDRPKYEQWHKETSQRLLELERLHLERTNGRLRDLENRPVIIQLSDTRIKELFDERAEVHAGRIFTKLLLSLGGTLGVILTAFFLTYFKLK
jgi:hypothetical protein